MTPNERIAFHFVLKEQGAIVDSYQGDVKKSLKDSLGLRRKGHGESDLTSWIKRELLPIET